MNKMKSKFQIYADFDGTISITDVGDKMFEKFTNFGCREILQDWLSGKIGSKEYYIRTCKIAKMTEQKLLDFCAQQKIDECFKTFVAYCRIKNYPVSVLSDGMDNYIKPILSQNDFQYLNIYANRLLFKRNGKIEPHFPYYEKGCLRCANCKGAIIKEFRHDGKKVVYVGDGLSDLCALPEADIIFAKDDLKKYCLEQNIQHYEFIDFCDLLEQFKAIETKITLENA